MTNFAAMAMTAAAMASAAKSVRISRQSESPEMSADFGSNAGSFQSFVQASCVAIAVARIRTQRDGVMSNESHPSP